MGGLQALIEAGARVHEPGCLGCIGMGQAPATGTNSPAHLPAQLQGTGAAPRTTPSTSARPETAAASALTGRITDPRTLGEYPKVQYPERYVFNPHWLFAPSPEPDTVQIVRGPNIKPFPTLNDQLVFDTFVIRLGFYPASPNDSYLQNFIIDGVPRAKFTDFFPYRPALVNYQ